MYSMFDSLIDEQYLWALELEKYILSGYITVLSQLMSSLEWMVLKKVL